MPFMIEKIQALNALSQYWAEKDETIFKLPAGVQFGMNERQIKNFATLNMQEYVKQYRLILNTK